MEKKLHIKAVAGRNIKVDAYWYKYGDNIDCYLTPAQFKDYVKGFLDFDIILEEDSSPTIDAEFTVVENKEEVVKNEQTPRLNHSEKRNTGKSSKKVG